MYTLNPRICNLYCLRCGEKFPSGDYYQGCPSCSRDGYPANMSLTYHGEQTIKTYQKGLFRYRDFLPYQTFPTLGEGSTPLVASPRLAERFALKTVYFKNEFQNPTGSHKDRMSPLVVARAVSLGRKCVVAASSGNAGVSLATYAAAAGIECKIISTRSINPVWKKAIELTGAELILTETSAERWTLMKKKVAEENWYPATNFVNPPVGSNLFGIQGYKTVAYEIYEDCPDALPQFVITPSARGDLLWGMHEGFKDLRAAGLISRLPALVAVEPFPRLSRVLDGEDYRSEFTGDGSATTSIGGNTVTFQAQEALKQSNGTAVNIGRSQVAECQERLARQGFYLESSSATVIGALAALVKNNIIPAASSVLLIATSSGYKDFPGQK